MPNNNPRSLHLRIKLSNYRLTKEKTSYGTMTIGGILLSMQVIFSSIAHTI